MPTVDVRLSMYPPGEAGKYPGICIRYHRQLYWNPGDQSKWMEESVDSLFHAQPEDNGRI